MEKLKRTSTNDPQYVVLTQVQKNIKDDIKLIEDSLFALSKKVVEIKSIVNREMGKVNEQVERSILLLADRRTADASVRQQYAMTSINNLALLLTEILDQLQAEQNAKQGENNKPGKKPGKKSGKGKSGQSLSKMQEQLNKQIEEMKNGQNPGGQKGKGQQKGSQEAEKAAREREFDDKREAKSPNENLEKTNIRFEEYKKEKMKEIELIKTVPPNLTPYYKDKVNQYFKQIP